MLSPALADSSSASEASFRPASTWRESLARYVEAFCHTTSSLDCAAMDRTLRVLAACDGLLIFTGVGQNGSLAQKVSMTYNSLSIRSICVDPVAALHGTMGLFRKNDILIPLSRSGNTAELITFLRACRRIGFDRILAVHGNPAGEMVRLAQWDLEVPVPFEADHLNLTPTASSVCFLAVLQSLAVAIASQRGLTREDFVATHPGGTLGKEPDVQLSAPFSSPLPS